MDFTEFDTRLSGYAVVIDTDDQILLARWNEGPEPLWTMPGGAIELDETIEDGVVREVKEETGYDVELGALLGVRADVISAQERLRAEHRTRPLRIVRVVYAATIIGGELTDEIDGSTDEARWFAPSEISQLPKADIIDVALGFAGRTANLRGLRHR